MKGKKTGMAVIAVILAMALVISLIGSVVVYF